MSSLISPNCCPKTAGSRLIYPGMFLFQIPHSVRGAGGPPLPGQRIQRKMPIYEGVNQFAADSQSATLARALVKPCLSASRPEFTMDPPESASIIRMDTRVFMTPTMFPLYNIRHFTFMPRCQRLIRTTQPKGSTFFLFPSPNLKQTVSSNRTCFQAGGKPVRVGRAGTRREVSTSLASGTEVLTGFLAGLLRKSPDA